MFSNFKYFRVLRSGEDDLTVPALYIGSILKAIKFDSREAQLLFPTLLQLKNLTSRELEEVFVSEVSPWWHRYEFKHKIDELVSIFVLFFSL